MLRAAASTARRARALVLDVLVRGALACSDGTLRLLGLRRSLRLVGARAGWGDGDADDTPSTVERVEDLGRARVQLVGVIMRRRSIWRRTTGPCLRQALLVSLVLRRHRPVIHLGVKASSAGPLAHAWVTVGRVRIDYDPSYVAFAPSS